MIASPFLLMLSSAPLENFQAATVTFGSRASLPRTFPGTTMVSLSLQNLFKSLIVTSLLILVGRSRSEATLLHISTLFLALAASNALIMSNNLGFVGPVRTAIVNR